MSLLVNQQIWKNNTTCLKMCHSSVSNGWKSLCFRGRRIFILVVVLWRCNCLNALKYFVTQPLQTSSEDPTIFYGAPDLPWSQHVCSQCRHIALRPMLDTLANTSSITGRWRQWSFRHPKFLREVLNCYWWWCSSVVVLQGYNKGTLLRWSCGSVVDLVLLPPVVVLAVFPSSDANETQSDQEGTVQRAMRSDDPLNMCEQGIRMVIDHRKPEQR